MLYVFVNGTSTSDTSPGSNRDAEGHQSFPDAVAHCVDKIVEICAGGAPTQRQVLQIGYNLGRLSEVAGLGRRVWDETKGFVEHGQWANLLHWVLVIRNHLAVVAIKEEP